jgi:hypothetical protein
MISIRFTAASDASRTIYIAHCQRGSRSGDADDLLLRATRRSNVGLCLEPGVHQGLLKQECEILDDLQRRARFLYVARRQRAFSAERWRQRPWILVLTGLARPKDGQQTFVAFIHSLGIGGCVDFDDW